MKRDNFFLLYISLFLLSDTCGMDIITKGRFDDKRIIKKIFKHFSSFEEVVETVSALTLVNKQFNHDFNTPAFTFACMRFLGDGCGDFNNYEDDIIKKLHTRGAYNYYHNSKLLLNLKHDAPRAALRWIKLGGDMGYRSSEFITYDIDNSSGSIKCIKSPLSNAVTKNLTDVVCVLLKKGVGYLYEIDLLNIALHHKNETMIKMLVENLTPDKYEFSIASVVYFPTRYAIQLCFILEKHDEIIYLCKNKPFLHEEEVLNRALEQRFDYMDKMSTVLDIAQKYNVKISELMEFLKKLIMRGIRYNHCSCNVCGDSCFLVEENCTCEVCSDYYFLVEEKYIKEAQRRDDKELLALIEQFDCGQNYGSHKKEKI